MKKVSLYLLLILGFSLSVGCKNQNLRSSEARTSIEKFKQQLKLIKKSGYHLKFDAKSKSLLVGENNRFVLVVPKVLKVLASNKYFVKYKTDLGELVLLNLRDRQNYTCSAKEAKDCHIVLSKTFTSFQKKGQKPVIWFQNKLIAEKVNTETKVMVSKNFLGLVTPQFNLLVLDSQGQEVVRTKNTQKSQLIVKDNFVTLSRPSQDEIKMWSFQKDGVKAYSFNKNDSLEIDDNFAVKSTKKTTTLFSDSGMTELNSPIKTKTLKMSHSFISAEMNSNKILINNRLKIIETLPAKTGNDFILSNQLAMSISGKIIKLIDKHSRTIKKINSKSIITPRSSENFIGYTNENGDTEVWSTTGRQIFKYFGLNSSKLYMNDSFVAYTSKTGKGAIYNQAGIQLASLNNRGPVQILATKKVFGFHDLPTDSSENKTGIASFWNTSGFVETIKINKDVTILASENSVKYMRPQDKGWTIIPAE